MLWFLWGSSEHCLSWASFHHVAPAVAWVKADHAEPRGVGWLQKPQQKSQGLVNVLNITNYWADISQSPRDTWDLQNISKSLKRGRLPSPAVDKVGAVFSKDAKRVSFQHGTAHPGCEMFSFDTWLSQHAWKRTEPSQKIEFVILTSVQRFDERLQTVEMNAPCIHLHRTSWGWVKTLTMLKLIRRTKRD